MQVFKNMFSYSSLEVILLGALGSILGVLILWVIRKPLPKFLKWIAVKAVRWMGVPVNEQKDQISILGGALKSGNYELALSCYFFHMFQAILWLILSSTSFVVAFLVNDMPVTIVIFCMGVVFLLFGAFYNGGIIMSVYSERSLPSKVDS